MKTLKLLVFGMILMCTSSVYSQLSVNVHIGTPPAWGPSGYNDVRYYYLPDVEAYYDVQTSMFVYISGNKWIRRSYLPTRYRNYDLYHGYKVVMNDYRGNSPYANFREHRMKYAKGYRGGEQHNIGERNNRNNYQVRPQENRQMNRTIERRDERSQARNSNQERENNKNENRGNDKKNGHDNGNDKGNGNRK
jgi:hypothetical protein